ncbi:MAG: reverse transcriptase domain-containing protein [Desulfococcaceae bacterium]
MPVRRKEIPKPGGVRLLGIPTVLDRVIQQNVAQVLNRIWEPVFSEHSFGFRPGRSQHDAIREYRDYVKSGLRFVVDIDLSKFFDRVNHDRLMARLATRIQDKRVLKLIRSFLTLHFIFVGSKRAGDRVMESISRFIEKKLRLRINRDKSAVCRPWERKYLGFWVTNSRKNPKIRFHWKTIKRFKERVREITARRRGRSIRQIIGELNRFMARWWNYFRIAESYNRLRPLPHWIRRRLRAVIWKP